MRLIKIMMLGSCVLWLTTATRATETNAPANVVRRLEPFVLKDLNDKIVKLDDFHGKSLLVIFFTMWAKPCQEQLPRMVELQKEYGGMKFSVLAISLDERDRVEIKAFVEKQGLNFPVLLGDLEAVRCFGGVEAIPVTFAVDTNHVILQKRVGTVEKEILEADVKLLLQK